MNKIILLGRLVNDPELKYGQTGTPTARFSIAVTRENDRNKADFFYCIAFGKLAEALANHCQKGRQILLDGRVEINTTPNPDGTSKTFVNVIANSIEFLAKPQSGQQSQPVQHQPAWNNPQQNMNTGFGSIDTGQDPRQSSDSFQQRFY